MAKKRKCGGRGKVKSGPRKGRCRLKKGSRGRRSRRACGGRGKVKSGPRKGSCKMRRGGFKAKKCTVVPSSAAAANLAALLRKRGKKSAKATYSPGVGFQVCRSGRY